MPIEPNLLDRLANLEKRIAHLETTAEVPTTGTDADTLDGVHLTGIQVLAYAKIGIASFTTNSNVYVDVTGGTTDITVAATSTVIVLGECTMKNANAGAHCYIRAVCGGTNGQDFARKGDMVEDAAHYQGWFTSVGAGTVTVHVEAHTEGGNNATFDDHQFVVIVIPE